MQALAQFINLLWHLCGKIVLFANVVPQIVKLDPHIIEEFDELEVAFSNRSIGSGAAELVMLIMRVMPKKFVALQLPVVSQQRDETYPVNTVPGCLLLSNNFEQRWI